MSAGHYLDRAYLRDEQVMSALLVVARWYLEAGEREGYRELLQTAHQ